MDVIAERTLELRGDDGTESPLLVQLGRPTQDEDGTWRCPYRIGEPYSFQGHAFGEDSIQALGLALVAIGAHLGRPQLKGRVTFCGETDLGFPEAFG